jgi:WD40 repeat protein
MDYPYEARDLKHPCDQSVATYKGHSVLRTLIRCYFSPVYRWVLTYNLCTFVIMKVQKLFSDASPRVHWELLHLICCHHSHSSGLTHVCVLFSPGMMLFYWFECARSPNTWNWHAFIFWITFCSTGQKYIYTGSHDSCVYIYDLVSKQIFCCFYSLYAWFTLCKVIAKCRCCIMILVGEA